MLSTRSDVCSGATFRRPLTWRANELAGIFLRTFVSVRVLALVQQQVIAYTAANEGLLDAGQGIYGMIDVEQRTVVRIQVGAYLGVDARRAFAFPADGLIPSLHAVHIGRRASQIAQITLEVWQLRDGFHLFQNALLAAAYDEFALVCGDGAEGTSSGNIRDAG